MGPMKSTIHVILVLLLAVLPAVAREEVVDHAGQRYRVVVAGPAAIRVLWKTRLAGKCGHLPRPRHNAPAMG